MFTYKIISNCCNLNYNINLYLIHFTSFSCLRSRSVIKRLSGLKSTPLPPSLTEHKIYFMVECHIVICLTWPHGCKKKLSVSHVRLCIILQALNSLAWVSGVSGGKGERWKQKRERAEGEKRLTHMLLLEPSTPAHPHTHDSIPSNQNQFRSLGCQLSASRVTKARLK